MKLRNTILTLLFGGLVGGHALREQAAGNFENADRLHRQFLQSNPGASAPRTGTEGERPRILFARLDDVDQPDVSRVFAEWPLGDKDWPVVFANLQEYAPRVTVVSDLRRIVEPSVRLLESVKNLPGLVLPASASLEGAVGAAAALPPSLPELVVSGQPDAIPEFRSLASSPLESHTGIGEIDLAGKSLRVTVEGDRCRVPMLARTGAKVVPTLALRALMAWYQLEAKDLKIQLGTSIRGGNGKISIPIDKSGFFRYFLKLAPPVESLNGDTFVLPPHQAKQYITADRPAYALLPAITDSLLWVGLDHLEARTIPLPGGTQASPAELTARALGAMQAGQFFRPAASRWQLAAAALTLAVGALLVHARKSWLWPLTFLAATGIIGTSLYLYQRDQLWIPILPSLAILGSTFLLSFLLPSHRPKTLPYMSAATRSMTRRTVRDATRPLPATPQLPGKAAEPTVVSVAPFTPQPEQTPPTSPVAPPLAATPIARPTAPAGLTDPPPIATHYLSLAPPDRAPGPASLGGNPSLRAFTPKRSSPKSTRTRVLPKRPVPPTPAPAKKKKNR